MHREIASETQALTKSHGNLLDNIKSQDQAHFASLGHSIETQSRDFQVGLTNVRNYLQERAVSREGQD